MTPIEGTPCARPVSGVHWKPSREVIFTIGRPLAPMVRREAGNKSYERKYVYVNILKSKEDQVLAHDYILVISVEIKKCMIRMGMNEYTKKG